jgi:hypothetical protein
MRETVASEIDFGTKEFPKNSRPCADYDGLGQRVLSSPAVLSKLPCYLVFHEEPIPSPTPQLPERSLEYCNHVLRSIRGGTVFRPQGNPNAFRES